MTTTTKPTETLSLGLPVSSSLSVCWWFAGLSCKTKQRGTPLSRMCDSNSGHFAFAYNPLMSPSFSLHRSPSCDADRASCGYVSQSSRPHVAVHAWYFCFCLLFYFFLSQLLGGLALVFEQSGSPSWKRTLAWESKRQKRGYVHDAVGLARNVTRRFVRAFAVSSSTTTTKLCISLDPAAPAGAGAGAGAGADGLLCRNGLCCWRRALFLCACRLQN